MRERRNHLGGGGDIYFGVVRTRLKIKCHGLIQDSELPSMLWLCALYFPHRHGGVDRRNRDFISSSHRVTCANKTYSRDESGELTPDIFKFPLFQEHAFQSMRASAAPEATAVAEFAVPARSAEGPVSRTILDQGEAKGRTDTEKTLKNLSSNRSESRRADELRSNSGRYRRLAHAGLCIVGGGRRTFGSYVDSGSTGRGVLQYEVRPWQACEIPRVPWASLS